ncbi:protein FEZ [Lactuca sativa]|uniref:NAC domain-containing protein n=1 Tax=Lactuca sativa TaxID=4236 RepID=A0A9R1VSD5_LACSA|nr:protein FEZ [Lactuca sativa]KAJ0210000.1 hypothetical protein LSAT_V11C400161290 [Lactuca sativa]
MIMEEKRDDDQKTEEMMLPGFRFHPTDEELVGFYLKRKIQEKPIPLQLIKPLDIYKHDPWDLPKLAMTGEKEWYFYCRRDRKYRNSARPNRVTGGGFWKATGTDRPIYSSDGSRCAGLKKSLVFYKGRAAKGFKTDWMMHEFRLPSAADHTTPTNRFLEKPIPPNELWAICRIFKKASSNGQRPFSHSWASPVLPEHPSLFSHFQQLDHKPFKIDPIPPTLTTNKNNAPPTFIPSDQDTKNPFSILEPNYNTTINPSSLLFNMPPSIFGEFSKQGLDYETNENKQGFSNDCFLFTDLPTDIQEKTQYDDHNQEHIVDMMFKSSDDVVYFEDQWDFTNPNNFIYE